MQEGQEQPDEVGSLDRLVEEVVSMFNFHSTLDPSDRIELAQLLRAVAEREEALAKREIDRMLNAQARRAMEDHERARKRHERDDAAQGQGATQPGGVCPTRREQAEMDRTRFGSQGE